VRRFLAATSEDGFNADEDFSKDVFLNRLTRYEEASAGITVMLACVAYWARPIHKAMLQKVLARSADRLELKGGLNVWLSLRWYPLLLELYSAGIAAVDAQRFDSLAAILYAPLPRPEYAAHEEMFTESVYQGLFDLHRTDVLKMIPGHERHFVPLSEYLFKTLQPKLDDVLFLGKNYEQAFDTFEVFYALSVADLDLSKGGIGRGPMGRFGWKYGSHENSPLTRIVSEGRAQQGSWPPLGAGLFGGSYDRFNAVATKYIESVSSRGWS
jgi:hypothetical protein